MLLSSAPQRLAQDREQTASLSAHSSPYSHRTTSSSDHSAMDSDDADMEPVQHTRTTTNMMSNRSSSYLMTPQYTSMSLSMPLQMTTSMVKPEPYGSEMMLMQYPASAWDEFLY